MRVEPCFPKPRDLVAALQGDDSGRRAAARKDIRTLFAEPIQVLIDRHSSAADSGRDPDSWAERMLSWQELRLRSARPADYEEQDWNTFFVTELAAINVFLVDTFAPSDTRDGAAGPPPRRLALPLPYSPIFHIEAYFLPRDHVGGDWYAAESAGGGTLWVMVADVTGKGPAAHLLAEGLPYLWQSRVLTRAREQSRQPRELLDVLDREISPVFPRGVFVEALLGTFSAEGSATVASAGACAIIRRKSGQRQITTEHLPGCWLGVGLDEPRSQQTWPFLAWDEMAMASDGLIDQRDGEGRLGDRLRRAEPSPGQSLHEQLVQLLENTLSRHHQDDDITLVTVRRHPTRGDNPS
jgi:hypothetical protein